MNNSQEYQSQQLKREQMLQQIILEQKQRIRELETQESNPPLKAQNELQQKSLQIKEMKQQLLDCNQQLEESKNLIRTLLSQKEQLEQEIQLLQEENDLKKGMEIQQVQKQYQQKLHQLESENSLLQQEIQQQKPQFKAAENYTQEETYIQQIGVLQEFLSQWQNQYLAEIIHYRRAAEISKQTQEQLSHRFHEDKKQLQKQLEDLQKLDGKIQEDVVNKLQTVLDGFTKFDEDLRKIQVPQVSNLQKLERMCQEGFDTETVWLKEKTILLSQIKEKELKQLQQTLEEDFKEQETSILKQEILQLKESMEDMKELFTSRENKLLKEIERYQTKCDNFARNAQNREIQFEEEIQRINLNIKSLVTNYEKREDFFKFNQEQLQHCLDKFRNITEQINTDLKQRKPNEHIKECKELIYKLNQKNQKKQPLKGVERLEILLKDMPKLPNKQMNEEIKQLLGEINRQLIQMNEAQSQTQQDEYLQELEGLIASPNKKINNLLNRFHKELQILTELRESTLQKPEIQANMPQSLPKVDLENQELLQLEQLRQIENDIHKKELNIAIEKSSKMIMLYEKKLQNVENQLRKSEQIQQKKVKELEQDLEQKQQELKQSKNQMFKYSKLVNDLQVHRLNERKEMIKLISDSEQKQIQQFQSTLKHIDQKCQIVIELLNKKLKFIHQKPQIEQIYNTKHQDNEIENEQQLQNEIKLYQQKEKEREEQISVQINKLSHIIEELQQNISNLHTEKGLLMEQLDTMNNLLQTQKKLYYSFRQQ